jgi:AcrR family transcriptional regulator
MGVSESTSSRLSVGDWVQAGFGIVAEEGLKALTIDRLCRRLGVTKGSFYWHFSDMKAYRTALIDAWAALRDEDRGHFDGLGALPPRARLAAMMAALIGPRRRAGIGSPGDFSCPPSFLGRRLRRC